MYNDPYTVGETLAVYPIITYDKHMTKPCPELDTPAPPFDFDKDGAKESAFNLTRLMLHNMLHHKGYGLSANQIGIPAAMFVINPILAARSLSEVGVFNPVIVGTSEETLLFEEGCLSFPGLFPKIERPSVVELRYQTDKGEERTTVFNGLTARVVLHEMDHLTGWRWYNRASKFHLDRAMRRRKMMLRKSKRIYNAD